MHEAGVTTVLEERRLTIDLGLWVKVCFHVMASDYSLIYWVWGVSMRGWLVDDAGTSTVVMLTRFKKGLLLPPSNIWRFCLGLGAMQYR